jgi:hypothetical protein
LVGGAAAPTATGDPFAPGVDAFPQVSEWGEDGGRGRHSRVPIAAVL